MPISRLALVAALWPLAAVHSTAAPAKPGPRVRVATGVLEGIGAPSGVQEFRGIPFAAPPMRERRWQPPQPAAPWSGVRLADRFAPQCMQARIYSDMVFRNDATSEDCLYLNVWAPPHAATAKLPVLVYFYGGGYVAGDGSEYRYDGESMARRGIVVVTVNYRLGLFGFFAHPELTRESPHHASGNYGLLDQAAALRWVHDNIAAFGGDARRVTIGGESAGSFSVSALMASPRSRDLIAGAIGESGAFFSTTLTTPSLATAEHDGEQFAASVGATSLAQLRAMGALELLAVASRPGGPRIGPDVDGWFFPVAPESIYARGAQAHVPLLAGWNSAELPGEAMLRAAPTPENVSRLVATTFGDQSAAAARFYPSSTPDEAARSATDLASDRFIAYSTWAWLDAQSATGKSRVYRYLFARPRPATVPAPTQAGQPASPPAPPATGAVHSAEIEYALGNLETNHVFAWTPDDYKVSATMESYFANFVKTGDPNGSGLPAWPVGNPTPDGRAMRMRIDVESHAEPEPRDRYLFLQSFYASGHR